MPTYVRETHSYDGDGFTTVGRVVDILSHSPTNKRVTVLVEKPNRVSFERATDEVSTEGVSLEEIAATVTVEDEETFYCVGTKGDGSRCTREVDEPGDYCWQHDEDDEE